MPAIKPCYTGKFDLKTHIHVKYIFLETSCIGLHIGDVSDSMCSMFTEIFTFSVRKGLWLLCKWMALASKDREKKEHHKGWINASPGLWQDVMGFTCARSLTLDSRWPLPCSGQEVTTFLYSSRDLRMCRICKWGWGLQSHGINRAFWLDKGVYLPRPAGKGCTCIPAYRLQKKSLNMPMWNTI